MDTASGTTRGTLVSLRASVDALQNRWARLDASASAKAVEILGASDREVRVDEAMLERARRRLVASATSAAGIASAAPSDLRHAPWLLWSGPEPLASTRALLELVVRRGAASASTRRNLIDAWLRGFDRDAPRIGEAGLAIRRLLAETSDLRLERWREADRAFGLFDPLRGPREVGAAILGGPGTVDEVLRRVGLDEPLRGVGGYARAVHESVRSQIPATIKAEQHDRRERLWHFLAPAGQLRFREPETVGAVARAVISPWLSDDKPSDAARTDVQAFLLRHLRDPRLQPQNWRHVGQEAVGIVRGWLARASLKAFFDLISEHALDEHFRYREAFWSACLRAGAIDDAWLALGSRVYRSARAVRDLNGAYGRLEGPGVAGDQSILIMRMGTLTLCDWSHNGKLRAWSADWKNAPRLGLSSYGRADVTGKGLPFPTNPYTGSGGAGDGSGLSHIGSDRGYWQGSAARLLAERVGLRLQPADWRVR